MIQLHRLDRVTTPPTITGAIGRAWMTDLDECVRKAGVKKEHQAAVGQFVVEAPWAHSGWHSYWVHLIHLRPIPKLGPPIMHVEGATHELWVYALDPLRPRQKMIETGRMAWLTPMNFGAQFIEPTDSAALERVEAAVKQICDGTLSPDTDSRQQWCQLFGGAMMAHPDAPPP